MWDRVSYCRERQLAINLQNPVKILWEIEFHPYNSTKAGTKNGGFAAHFACEFFKCSRGGTRFLIIVSEDFANLSLITAHDSSSYPYSSCPNIDDFRNIYAKIEEKYACSRSRIPLASLAVEFLIKMFNESNTARFARGRDFGTFLAN